MEHGTTIQGFIVKSIIDGVEATVSICPYFETELGKEIAVKFIRKHTVIATVTMLPNEDEIDFKIRLAKTLDTREKT